MDKKEPSVCEEMFESFALAEQQQPSTRNSIPATRAATSSVRGVHHVSQDISVAAAIEAMAKEIKDLKVKINKCEICRGGHKTSECPVTEQEQVDSLNSGWLKPPYQNYTSNSNWRTQNSNWRGGNPPGLQPRQNQFTSGDAGASSGGSNGDKNIEEMLATQTQMLAQLIGKDQETQQKLQEHDTLLRNQQNAFLDLQRSVGDIARQLTERKGGSFPGGTETNPKSSVKAVMTRSGKGGEMPSVDDEEPVDEDIEAEVSGKVHPTRRVPPTTAQLVKPLEKKKEVDREFDRVPYPARLLQEKNEKEYGKFLELFNDVDVVVE